jgi:hypothetical protein
VEYGGKVKRGFSGSTSSLGAGVRGQSGRIGILQSSKVRWESSCVLWDWGEAVVTGM